MLTNMRTGKLVDMSAPLPPLDDPRYVPEHPPVNGIIPDVVAKWGPRSQTRWFNRFIGEVKPMRTEEWARFYCSSEEHRGGCCVSCTADQDEGYYDLPGYCCCKAIPA